MRKRTLSCYAIASLAGITTLAAGCSDIDGNGDTGSVNAALTAPTLGQFVVLANHSASFDDRSVVAGGDVGVAAGAGAVRNTLTAGANARIGIGAVSVAQSITLRDRAAIGAVEATSISAPSDATIGARSAFVAPPAPPTLDVFTAGTMAVNVVVGQTSSLAAGKYGTLTVNGTLNLTGGTYDVQSLHVGNDAKVVALASATIRMTGGLVAGDRAHLSPAAPLGAGGLRLVIAGTVDANNTSASCGNDDQLTALIVARGAFRALDRLIATGAIAAQDVILGHDTKLTFGAGFGCGSAAACDDANPCTVDACVSMQCTHAAAGNGTACNDGNACTQTDTCQAGVCQSGSPVVCGALDQCHVAGTCSAATGVCSNPNQIESTPCNDGNPNTVNDACVSGVCQGTQPVLKECGKGQACTPVDQCHGAGTCDATTLTCTMPALPDGTACNDGNPNTINDACVSGACVGTTPILKECGKGQACTPVDQCHGAGTCDTTTLTCTMPALPDGTACDDGNPNTTGDTCVSGICQPGS